jgi:2OG-Fe dioxygenase
VPTVSDDPNGKSPDLEHVWAAMAGQGYALTSEDKVGLPEKFRKNFVQTYFTEGRIRHDPGDWPVDRKRARDVVRYWWRDGGLRLREHRTIAITDRAGIPGRRVHSRVRLLEDPQAEEFIRTLLSLVPPGRRRPTGTFGVNLFRTFTDVVTKPHRDNEELIFLYVLDRQGEGAESYLYDPHDVTPEGKAIGNPIMQQQLNPGDIIIFDDARFMHGATPLEALPDGTSMRDVLVCTVDYRATYLTPRARFRALRGRIRSAAAARPQGNEERQLSPVA